MRVACVCLQTSATHFAGRVFGTCERAPLGQRVKKPPFECSRPEETQHVPARLLFSFLSRISHAPTLPLPHAPAMPLSALLFDLDGTLLDTNDQHARAWQRALDHLGYRVPAGRILLEIGKGSDRVVPMLVGEQAEERHGPELRDAHSEAYRKIVEEEEEVRVFPQAEALIETARERGLETALVTASNADDLERVLDRAGADVTDLVDAVVTGDDAEKSKPAPDSVQAAVDKLNAAPGQCAMVGDTPYDALAARRAGVVGLGVRTGAHPPEALHRAGMRATYEDPVALRSAFDDAAHRAAPGQKPLTEAHLKDLMQEALDEAWAGLSESELPIGSVVTGGAGRIAGRGHNRARATGSRVSHAEMMALADAASSNGAPLDEEGAVLVSTVEPCTMCLGAAMEAGVDTVVYALRAEPNGGAERVTPPEHGVFPRVIGGVRAGGSRMLLRRWADRHPDDAFAGRLLDEA